MSEEDEQSNDGQSEGDSQSDAESEVVTPAKRPARRGSDRNTARTDSNTNSRTQPSPPAQATRRRSSRGSREVSHVEKGSESEFEEPPSEDDLSEDEESVLSPQKRSRRSPKKKPGNRQNKSRKGKRAKQISKKKGTKSKARPRKRRREESDSEEDSDIEGFSSAAPRTSGRSRSSTTPWPDIPRQDITGVTRGVMKHMRELDTDNLFGVPVLESFPEVQESYDQLISHPMDFRTMEEERIHCHESIRDLQEDLILVFENCIRFNGALSRFGEHAQGLPNQLDDACENVDG